MPYSSQKVSVGWHAPLAQGIYISDRPLFSYIGIVDKKYKQTGGWHSCRETFAAEFRKFLCPDAASKWIWPVPPSTRKLRMVTVFRAYTNTAAAKGSIFISQMKNAVNILNAIESKLGWTLTKCMEIDTEETSEIKAKAFLLDSSSKWIHTTQLLSIYLLIIRVSKAKEFEKVKTYSDFKEAMVSVINNGVYSSVSNKDSTFKSDVIMLKGIHKLLLLVLDNVKELFFDVSRRDQFFFNTGTYGIQNLARGYGSKGILATLKTIKDRQEVALQEGK